MWIETLLDFIQINLLVVFLSTLVIGVLVQRQLPLLKYRLPPGPVSLPIIGHLPFVGNEKHLYFHKLSKKYGSIFSLYLGSRFTVVISDFESIKEVSHKDAFSGRPPGLMELIPDRPHIGDMNGSEWKEHRRFMLSSFRELGMGKSHGAIAIQNLVEIFIKTLKDKAGTTIKLRDVLVSETNNSMFTMIANRRFDKEEKLSQVVERFQQRVSPYLHQNTRKYYYPFLRFFINLFNSEVVHGIKAIRELEVEMEKEVEKHEKEHGEGDNKDFIDFYLDEIKQDSSKSFTRDSMLSNSLVLILAGAEASQITLEWMFSQLVKHPDVQEKMHNEIVSVVGRNRLPEWNDRNSLPYSQAVLLEVMRYVNMMPVNEPRLAMSDETIGKYEIPKGTNVVMSYWSVHMDPNIWGDPETFRPERFLSEDGQSINQLSQHVLSFSIGKRSCPGEGLAKMTLFLYYSAVIQNFRILAPKGGLNNEVLHGIGVVLANAKFVFQERTTV